MYRPKPKDAKDEATQKTTKTHHNILSRKFPANKISCPMSGVGCGLGEFVGSFWSGPEQPAKTAKLVSRGTLHWVLPSVFSCFATGFFAIFSKRLHNGFTISGRSLAVKVSAWPTRFSVSGS